MWVRTLMLMFFLVGCSAKVKYGDLEYNRRGGQELKGVRVEITKTETSKPDGTNIVKTVTRIYLDEQKVDTEAYTQTLNAIEKAAEAVIKRSLLP